ncbi:MAG: hypothetical protein NTW19_02675 [Planctomycetota bacterium]|nr:hypothetical protein [Planctomycetota bacterium]
MTPQQGQVSLAYTALPLTVLLTVIAIGAIERNTESWHTLMISELNHPYEGRFCIHSTNIPDGTPGHVYVNADYPQWFYEKARLGDHLEYGLCHIRLVRDGALVTVLVQWNALPAVLIAAGWVGLLTALIAWPTLLPVCVNHLQSWKSRLNPFGRAAATVTKALPTTDAATTHSGPVAGFTKALRFLFLGVPFLWPALFAEFYEPVNRDWTVKHFGCGCPPIDGGFRFNANYVNGLLWMLIFAGCAAFWIRRLRRTFPGSNPLACGIGGSVGITILLIHAARLYAQQVWL